MFTCGQSQRMPLCTREVNARVGQAVCGNLGAVKFVESLGLGFGKKGKLEVSPYKVQKLLVGHVSDLLYC